MAFIVQKITLWLKTLITLLFQSNEFFESSNLNKDFCWDLADRLSEPTCWMSNSEAKSNTFYSMKFDEIFCLPTTYIQFFGYRDALNALNGAVLAWLYIKQTGDFESTD